ncbi:site-specific integrase [Escherichia coli]|nr:site-specific integrase [Escherichia coli]EIA9508294.1 site-specific integrase [Escherichia coli]EIM6101901.1 site-specific integrase [Escherichia coli]EJR3910003.1 site-specific integrase [Escherichia coli]EKG3307721.1 site-specific integrase [Escherichia coli]
MFVGYFVHIHTIDKVKCRVFILTQLNINQRQRLWALMDTHTRQPLLYPLIYLIDHLALRSSATQSASLQALKFFYEFWHQKHGVTFCFSFYSSNHNPLIAIDELTAFFHYLENTHLYVPALTIRSTTQTTPQRCTNIRHVHSVIRFIRYLINTYISPRYIDGTPKELTRLATQLTGRLSIHKAEFRTLTHSRQMNNGTTHKRFRSLTAEMVMAFYQIITPGSISKKNPLNPFPAGEIQLRNFLICRLLLNYGLRVSELLLLECHSIKPNLRGDQFSLIVTTVDDDVSDQRKRLPSLKNVYANRVLALDKLDFHFLNIYIHKIRPQASHSFLFTSTQRLHPPLSYHAVYDIFTRIDDIMSVQYHEYKKDEYYDAIESISPHITRHTWAYLTLQRIYRDKLQKIKANSHLAAIDFSIVGLMDEAKDELRLLGGWSHNSHMPDLYAKRFLSQQANTANLQRIVIDNEALKSTFSHVCDEWSAYESNQ